MNAPQRKSLKFGLDMDGVVTEDYEFFMMFVTSATKRGHEVHLVTMRYQSELASIPQEFLDACTTINATARGAKKPFMEKLGIPIDVWIDDNPQAIFMDAQQAFGGQHPEGTVSHRFSWEPDPVVAL